MPVIHDGILQRCSQAPLMNDSYTSRPCCLN
jgi:hypothetical protein